MTSRSIGRDQRPEVLAEFYRVLVPGGVVMLVFQIGNEHNHRTELFGTRVSLHWYRQQPEEVANLLRKAGFELWMTAVREREDGESTPQAYLLARKPGLTA